MNKCRVCLDQKNLNNIFKKQYNVKISSMLKHLTKINISPYDGLPKWICAYCLSKLKLCTDFIKLCQESDKKLRATISSINDDEGSQPALEIDFESGKCSVENNIDYAYSPKEQTVVNKNGDNFIKQDVLNIIVDEQGENKKIGKQQCFTCGKVMSSRFRLKTHLRTHTGERPFTCSYCNKNFSLEDNLKVHMRRHTGEKPLQCNVCGQSFAHTSGLAAHKRKHTGQLPYQCVLCPRRFRTNGHLQYHTRRHTGEKNFECDNCGKAFITRSGLKQHALSHTGDRPHECTVCGKRMTRASHVKRHMQQAHQGLFACNSCSDKFAHKVDLAKHKKLHIEEKPCTM